MDLLIKGLPKSQSDLLWDRLMDIFGGPAAVLAFMGSPMFPEVVDAVKAGKCFMLEVVPEFTSLTVLKGN
jgi:hypothetical protein